MTTAPNGTGNFAEAQAYQRRLGDLKCGDIMTRKARVASANRPLVELVSLLAEGGHHHIPILDAELRLVGIVTQTDLVSALYSIDSHAT